MRTAASLQKSTSAIETAGLRRGDAIYGGRFVGKVRQSTIWVCYDPGELAFQLMCEQFDRLYGPKPRRLAAVA